MSLNKRDIEYVWHPFTQHKTCREPLRINRAQGSYLYTDDGKKIIDAISSWWVTLHGHCHPYIIKQIQEQLPVMEQVIFAGCTHEPAVSLAERIIKHLPEGFGKGFYSDNGSTAVEVALKMAIQYFYNLKRPRKKILAFKSAYHGDTFGSMAVSDRGAFTSSFHSLLFDVDYIDPPLRNNERGLALSKLKTKIENDPDSYAAFIYEPLVQGAGGMLMHNHSELSEMIKVAKSSEIICIADEVMTGFGRTGRFFASDYLSSKPDIVCLSKGITGGVMPLALTVAKNYIFEAFLSDDHSCTFFHGHSYTANPVACTAGLASLDLLEEQLAFDSLSRVELSHGRYIEELLSDKDWSNYFKDIRQQGTILALEWNTNSNSGYFNNISSRMSQFFLDRGILLRPLGNVTYILPPYCISQDELDEVYTAIKNFALYLN